jgi:hypothetical protein
MPLFMCALYHETRTSTTVRGEFTPWIPRQACLYGSLPFFCPPIGTQEDHMPPKLQYGLFIGTLVNLSQLEKVDALATLKRTTRSAALRLMIEHYPLPCEPLRPLEPQRTQAREM